MRTSWYRTGQKKEETIWKDGKGVETTFYENGQKAYEATFKDGKKVSETRWDEEGNEIK